MSLEKKIARIEGLLNNMRDALDKIKSNYEMLSKLLKEVKESTKTKKKTK